MQFPNLLCVLKKKVVEGKRPTKLEIPQDSIGGDMDGMDFDNAPAPPMGLNDMDGDDTMDSPMGDEQDQMGEGPNAMGGEDPMGDEQDPMASQMDDSDGGSQEDEELSSILDGMSIEDKAAVIKYAKSMTDGNNGGDDDGMGQMPESRRSLKKIIDETLNSVINDGDNGIRRLEKKLPKKYRDKKDNPFVSPY